MRMDSAQWSLRKGRAIRIGAALLLCAGLMGAATSPGARSVLGGARADSLPKAEAQDLADLTARIQDLETTLRVTKYEPKELEKIGADFKTTYSLRTLTLQYKQPDKLRLEGKSPTRGTALLILNG